MIIELGQTEEKILHYLRDKPMKNFELCIKVYRTLTNNINESTRNKISQSCNLLIKKGLVKKVDQTFFFIKDLEIVSEVRGDKRQKILTVPNRESTKTWQRGDKIKLVNLDRK